MLVQRRTFLTGSSAALALGGCATVPRATETGCTPLAPVDATMDRLIRSVAGLRPYRASGFVVRREMLGDKALVHNYGHGGAGITLSWGSSKLATDLGLAGHSGPVAVIGSGALGLTTARLAQEAGFPVTIYTKALWHGTTSAVAGGQISPFGHYREDMVTDAWRAQFKAAMAYSWSRFQLMVGSKYGIRWLPTYEDIGQPLVQGDWMDPYYPNARELAPKDHPFPMERVVRFDTMYVETPRFLAQLAAEVLGGGGKVRLRTFDTPAAITELPERLVFNCTGIGAHDLFGDTDMQPVRGQLAVLIPQPEVRYAASGDWGYMFPRGDGILLGGTFERGVWDPVPVPARIARIVAAHKHFFDDFRCRL